MTATKTVEIKLERMIPAPPGEVFDAWLDPKVPGTLWHQNEKLIIDPKIDGLWYLLSLKGSPHYGRFVEIERPGRLRHTWMSRHTLGEESMVTVTFEKGEAGTLMTLRHSGLPNDDMATAHEKGWNSILEKLTDLFVGGLPRRT